MVKRGSRRRWPGWMLHSGAAVLSAFFLGAALTGCTGTEEKQKPSSGMLEPQDPPSGNKARDKYDEMLREEQEERPGY